MNNEQGPILFYDGNCGLCAYSVQWVLRHEKRPQLRFAPLQGPSASSLLPQELTTSLNTLALEYRGQVYLRSEALAQTLSFMGRPVLAQAIRLFPLFLRDAVYRIVAKNRHHFKNASCLLPTAQQRARFLP